MHQPEQLHVVQDKLAIGISFMLCIIICMFLAVADLFRSRHPMVVR